MKTDEDNYLPVGTPIWFPAKWECGVIDSILAGPGGKVMAYVVKREDGSKVAIDMQVAEEVEN